MSPLEFFKRDCSSLPSPDDVLSENDPCDNVRADRADSTTRRPFTAEEDSLRPKWQARCQHLPREEDVSFCLPEIDLKHPVDASVQQESVLSLHNEVDTEQLIPHHARVLETESIISIKENGKLHAVALSLMELSCSRPADLMALLDEPPAPPLAVAPTALLPFQDLASKAASQSEMSPLRQLHAPSTDPFSSPGVEAQIDSLIEYSIKKRRLAAGLLSNVSSMSDEDENENEHRQVFSFTDPTLLSTSAVSPAFSEATQSTEAVSQRGDSATTETKIEGQAEAKNRKGSTQDDRASAPVVPAVHQTCTGLCLKRSILRHIQRLFAAADAQLATKGSQVAATRALLASLSGATQLSVPVLEYLLYQSAGDFKLLKKLVLDYLIYDFELYRQKQFWTPELDRQLRKQDLDQLRYMKETVLFASGINYLYKRIKWLKELEADQKHPSL